MWVSRDELILYGQEGGLRWTVHSDLYSGSVALAADRLSRVGWIDITFQ